MRVFLYAFVGNHIKMPEGQERVGANYRYEARNEQNETDDGQRGEVYIYDECCVERQRWMDVQCSVFGNYMRPTSWLGCRPLTLLQRQAGSCLRQCRHG